MARPASRLFATILSCTVLASCDGPERSPDDARPRNATVERTGAVARASSLSDPSAAACPAEPPGSRLPSRVLVLSATSAEHGETVPLVAQVTDAGGVPLPDRLVHLQLGDDGASATTDEWGLAQVELPVEAAPGERVVQAEFAGDGAYAGALAEAPFTVRKAWTELRVETAPTVATGTDHVLAARLVRRGGIPVVGRPVVFRFAGRTASATTDGEGVASVSVPLPAMEAGPASVEAAFAGDTWYEPSADAAPVLRFLPTRFVIWGGNTPGLQLGDRVNFWGHSWTRQITGGEYDPTAEFKGWAQSIRTPGVCSHDCWSSKPGQSFPPEPLPRYIGVIVTTSLVKRAGTVYGDTAALGIVRVDEDPRYAGEPGKPGWGVLVDVVDGAALLPPLPAVEATQAQPADVAPGESFEVAIEVVNPTTATARDVRVAERFEGSTPLDGAEDAGALAPGERASVTFAQTADLVAPRAADESSEAYLQRLASADGRALPSAGSVTLADAYGRPTRAVRTYSSSRLALPRLSVALSAPPCTTPGAQIDYRVVVFNLGRAGAESGHATVSLPDGTSAELAVGAIAPGGFEEHVVTWTVPAVGTREPDETIPAYVTRAMGPDGQGLTATVELSWLDRIGNLHGTVSATATSVVRVPVLLATPEQLPFLLPSAVVPLRFDTANVGSGTAFEATLGATDLDGTALVNPAFELSPGASRSVTLTGHVPPFLPRGGTEDEAGYRGRLGGANGRSVAFPFALTWRDVAGAAYGPIDGFLRTVQIVPIVEVALTATPDVTAGDPIAYAVTVTNAGLADAASLAVVLVTPDGAEAPIALPSTALAKGASSSATATYTVPASAPAGTVTATARIAWRDAAGNAYGPLTATADTEVKRANLPPVVDAGPDLTITLPAGATLAGKVTDDGLPLAGGLTTSWLQVSGPGTAAIGAPRALTTDVSFDAPGTYVLRLFASDSQLTASDELTVEVLPPEGSGTTIDGDTPAPGDVINVVQEGNVFRLDDTARAFEFIWVAVSSKGTVVKIDTNTGAVLGEYWTSPANQAKDPSRTTVDHNGNVWATNRAGNSVVRIGLVENGQCIDRNANGVIDTSTGLDDVRPWTNAGDADTSGGTSTAADECILDYVRVASSGTRHVSVDENNDVWVSGTGSRSFDLIDGRSGTIIRHEPSVGYGGYGGLIDANGVIWSARPLLRWDTAKSLTGVNGVNWRGWNHDSYGLCIDSHGNVWNTEWGWYIRKFAPDGTLLGTYSHGYPAAQGCVVDANDDVWVAHATSSNTVGHLKNDGTFVGRVTVLSGPTGVAVDRKGRIWATNYGSRKVSRIDPTKGPIGQDGKTRVGEQDLVTVDLGGYLYNYSDMTGSTLSGAPESGTIATIYDGGAPGASWGRVSWLGRVCGDGALFATAASSEDGVTFGAPVQARNGREFVLPNGRYLKVTFGFQRSTKGQSPELYSFTVGTTDYVQVLPDNTPPVVNAGRDRTVTYPNPLRLTADACDDALPGDRPLAMAWSKVSGPGEVTFADAGADRTDAAFGAPGTYVLRITADDGELAATDDVTVTVLPANAPPQVDAGPSQVAVNLPDALPLPGVVTDDGLPEPAALTVSWSRVSGPGTVTFAPADRADTSATFSASGTYVLRLTGFDGHLTASADVTVVANPAPPVNAAPEVSAGPNLSIAAGATASLQGSVTDDGLPAGKAVTVTWSKVSGPGTVTFGNVHAAATTARFSAAGQYVLRLSASDTLLTGSSEVNVAVAEPAAENSPPVVSAGANDAVTLPASAAVRGTVRDDGLPAGAPLAIAWSKVSGPGTVTFADAGSVETQASFSAAGTYVLRLTANDTQFRASSDVTVVVSAAPAANEAPLVNAGPSQEITFPTRTAVLAGTVSDDGRPAGAALTIAWSLVSGPGAVSFAKANAATTTATFPVAGTYRLRLTASDTRLGAWSETVVVVRSAPAGNQAPVVAASAETPTITLPDDVVVLHQSATDDGLPDGGGLSLAWELVTGPTSITFGRNAEGLTEARFYAPGDYVLRFSATDSELTSSALVQVKVLPDVRNRPPVLVANVPDLVLWPSAASLSGSLTDDGLPASGTLTVGWSKVDGPGTVTFSRPDRVATSATFGAPGVYTLRLTAHDGELETTVEATVPVVQAPTVDAGPAQVVAWPTSSVLLSGAVSDDGQPSGGTLTSQWSQLAGPGTVTFAAPGEPVTTATFPEPGVYVLELGASDGQFTSRDEVTITVTPPEGPVPEIAISGVADGARVTMPVDVIGSVSDGFWQLEYASNPGAGSRAVWTTIASGTGAVSNGTLGTFDPTMLLNGAYAIRLSSTTTSGETVTSVGVTVEGGAKIGNFTLAFKDLAVPVAGLPIEVTRTYDSRDKRVGEFGVGWRLDVASARVEKTTVLGNHWATSESGGTFPIYCVVPDKAPIVTVTMPTGKVYRFQATVDGACQYFSRVQFTTARFEPIPPTRGTLTSPFTDVYVGDYSDGTKLLNVTDFDVWNPTSFRLTTEDGTVYDLDEKAGVRAMTDRNGNRLTIGSGGIVHTSGKSVTFTRDASGRITKITDPAGEVLTYGYDANGDLATFTDREGAISKFTHDAAHRLLSYEDPRGVQPIRNEYDEDGRLVSHTDAFGKTVVYAHDLNARQEALTDRLGRLTLYEYDARGNVVRITDREGGVRRHTYDANDNVLTETDPLDRMRTFTYDAAGNKLTESDALGNTWRYTYDAFGQVLTATDPLGRLTTHVYDARGNRLATTDASGATTSWTYDARGLPVTETDPLGGVTGKEYDADGNLALVTDPLGHVTRFTYDASGRRLAETRYRTVAGVVEELVTSLEYDAEGRLTRTTQPDGASRAIGYDETGRKTSETDPLGRVTTYEYDDAGRLTRTEFPDGTTEASEYDAEGRLRAKVDRGGRRTSFETDGEGRRTRTVFADGTERTTAYDMAAQVVAETSEDGSTITYGYDGAGRRTSETNAVGETVVHSFDAAGNEISTKDPRGNTTTFGYDAVDRLVRTTFADGTFEAQEWDARGRNVSKTDAAGHTTRFEYDAAGRLVAVTDALGGVTRYGYDEVGNRIVQTDANGHATTFAFDGASRMTARMLPLGQTETFSYDAAGNRRTRTSFAGKVTSYEYDVANRLVSKTPDSSFATPPVMFTYTATGQRASMTDASGTTTYAYDSRDRLVAKASSAGTLTYAYDAAGRVTRIQSSHADGVSVRYAYDAAGRLASVTDERRGGTTTYAYDPAGNLAGWTLPNGVVTTATYDRLNRLTMLETSGDGPIARYAYTLGPAGNRLSVAELSGRSVTYAYDALFRLTGETVTDDPAGVNGSVTYQYDPVGNRLSRISSLAPVATESYAYDANDRLSSEAYDANGNTIASGGNSYAYDFEDRFESANGGAVRIVYDGDGNRVARVEGGETTAYVVDEFNPTGYAQVLEEIRGGAVERAYVYGHALLSQHQRLGGTWTASFYGYDGQGSVRFLTDKEGSVTDAYQHDAFGAQLGSQGSTPNDYRFAGEQLDVRLGLVYLRARYMSPASGRFMSMDPVLGEALDPLSLHRYAYARNAPVDFIDPSGEYAIAIALARQIAGFAADAQYDAAFRAIGMAFEGGADDELADDLVNYGFQYLLSGMVVDKFANRDRVRQEGTRQHDSFKEEIADLFRKAGYTVRVEETLKTELGLRRIDVMLYKKTRSGELKAIGGIEIKIGGSRYRASQRAKDDWLWFMDGIRVNVIRRPRR